MQRFVVRRSRSWWLASAARAVSSSAGAASAPPRPAFEIPGTPRPRAGEGEGAGDAKPTRDVHRRRASMLRPTRRIPAPTADDTDRRVTGTVKIPAQLLDRTRNLVRKAQKVSHLGIQRMAEDLVPAWKKDPEDPGFPFSRAALAKAQVQDEEGADKMVQAYMMTRMPSVHAGLLRACIETSKRLPSLEPKSLLHYGACLGEGVFAARQNWAKLGEEGTIVAVEPIDALRKVGQGMTTGVTGLPKVKWGPRLKLELYEEPEQYDVVLVSNVQTDLSQAERQDLMRDLWSRCKGAMIIVEPGTPSGFEPIAEARDTLLSEEGARVAAPCPHSRQCPMTTPACAKKDWCSISQRHLAPSFQITALNRDRPGGFNWMDWKFSYVAMARPALFDKDVVPPSDEAEIPNWGRIVRPPMKRSGHVIMELCTADGDLERRIVAKSHKEEGGYRAARTAEWGDAFAYKAFGHVTKLSGEKTNPGLKK